MKALVYQAPKTLSFEDVPMPLLKEGEALVKVEYVGICGSDMHAYLGHDERRPAPLILGHEAAGVIKGGARDGEPVTINPLVPCLKCEACLRGEENLCPKREIISLPPREGAFAEYIAIPERNLVRVPKGISLEKASLCEPIACGWNAARKAVRHLGERAAQSRALVIGGGAIGVGSVLSLKANGIEDVTILEPHEGRREILAQHLDARILNSEDLASDESFDFAVDAVGIQPTRALASAIVRPGGGIAHIGLGSAEGGLDIRRMTLQGIAFYGVYTYTPNEFKDTAKAIFSGALGALEWVDIRPLSEGVRAFEALFAGQVAHPKIILKT